MSTQGPSPTPHKARWSLVVFLLTLVILGAIYRTELSEWFAPLMGASQAGEAANRATTGSIGKHKQVFDPATLERLRSALASYEQLRTLLAGDSLQGLEPQAQSLVAALRAAEPAVASADKTLAPALASATQAASELGAAQDLATARARFGRLSEALVALIEADTRLAKGRHLFRCPMAEGYPSWFQPHETLENPYMGTSMLECGEAIAWPSGAPERHAHTGGDVAYYTCSMHPSVRSPTPGKCPICGMDLTPVTRAESESGTIVLDEARRQRSGVRTEPVERRALSLEIRSVGVVRYDETRLSDVNLRMSGWVTDLLVDETGQRVKAGQTLFTLYSPELFAASLEHVAARARAQQAEGQPLPGLVAASRQRLRLLGMTEAQVSALEGSGKAVENLPIASPASGYVIEKTIVRGARIEAGTRVYRIADLSKVWIDSEIYEADLPHVRVGQRVSIELPHTPDASHEGKVDYVYPALEGATRTARARIVLENPKLALKPDMYANVSFEVALGEKLAVPDSAVVYTGPRRLVFIDKGEGRFEPREVTLGVHAGGHYEIASGVQEGEVVVTSGNFLIAAESRIRSATEHWEHGEHAQ